MRKAPFLLAATLGLSGPALGEAVLINTDSTINGSASTATSAPATAGAKGAGNVAPPLPVGGASASSSQRYTLQPNNAASGERAGQGADEMNARASQFRQQVASGDSGVSRLEATRDAERREAVMQQIIAEENGQGETSKLRPATPLSLDTPEPAVHAAAEKPSDLSPAPSPAEAWSLDAGMLRQQVMAWGKEDSLWDVIWEGDADLHVEVPHTFTGSLDEVVIDVVTAFANQGAPIRLQRAQANHKLIVRSGSGS